MCYWKIKTAKLSSTRFKDFNIKAKPSTRHRDAWKSMMAGSPPFLFHPVQVLFQEHAKHMVTIKELQSKVQVLQDFRTKVLQTFPQLESNTYGHPNNNNNRMVPPNLYAGNNGGPTSPRKSPMSGKGGRVLPSVQKVSPPSTGKRVLMKSQTQTGLRDQGTQSGSGVGTGTTRGRFSERTNWGSKKFVVVAQGKNWLRLRPHSEKSDSELEDSDEDQNSTSDSLHSMMEQPDTRKTKLGSNQKGDGTIPLRQDSGFSTDGKERLTQDRSSDVQWAKVDSVEEDELMTLLEMIAQKGKILRNQIEKSETGCRYTTTLSDIGLKPEDVLTEIERLRSEKEQLLERFVYVEVEKEMYKGEMTRLRDLMIDSETIRRTLEDRLEVSYTEREQLRSRLRDIRTHFTRPESTKKDTTTTNGTTGARVPTSNRTSSSSASGYLRDALIHTPCKSSSSLPDRLNHTKLRVRMDKSKISSILQESRPLELQRELLVAVLRNELLKSQLEQSLSEWNEKITCWQQTESKLHTNMEICQRTCTELQNKLDHTENELRVERSKRQVLERALEAAYRDLTGSNTRGERTEGVSAAEAVRQLSVETFPVHQIPMNISPDKVLDRPSPHTWRLNMMSGNNPASESTLKPISQLSYHLSRLQSNENHNDISSNHGDAFSKSNYKENGYSDDGDVDATITNMCLRLPDVKLGNVANVYDDPRGGKKLPTVNFNQGARRLSLMDFNGTKSDRGETNLKPMVYFNGSSPKSRPLDIFTSRYSQSSDALQNSDWEWTYDVQGTSQNVAHISERLNLSEAKT